MKVKNNINYKCKQLIFIENNQKFLCKKFLFIISKYNYMIDKMDEITSQLPESQI